MPGEVGGLAIALFHCVKTAGSTSSLSPPRAARRGRRIEGKEKRRGEGGEGVGGGKEREGGGGEGDGGEGKREGGEGEKGKGEGGGPALKTTMTMLLGCDQR